MITHIMGFNLIQTCPSNPEQYDVYLGKLKVGYLQLMDGKFKAMFPDDSGEQVYLDFPGGQDSFEELERYVYLNEAVSAIHHCLHELIRTAAFYG